MARPGLMRHRKFTRLARLVSGRALARGSLELIWDAAFENGDDLLGSVEDVEAVAEWQGDPGALVAALLEAGFLDESPEGLRVHDLFDHAPEYVARRKGYEEERRKPKACEECGGEFRSREARARFCSNACRQASYRKRDSDEETPAPVTPRDGRVTEDGVTRALRVTEGDGRVTDRYAPPAPAPAPAPAPLRRSDPPPPVEDDDGDPGPFAPEATPTAVLRAGTTIAPQDVPEAPPAPPRPWEAFRRALAARLAVPEDYLRVSRAEAVEETRTAIDEEVSRLGLGRAVEVAFEVAVRAKNGKPRWLSYFVPALRDARRVEHREGWEGESPPPPGGPEYPEPTPEQLAAWEREAKAELDERERRRTALN